VDRSERGNLLFFYKEFFIAHCLFLCRKLLAITGLATENNPAIEKRTVFHTLLTIKAQPCLMSLTLDSLSVCVYAVDQQPAARGRLSF
jgi:hypothetical protein